MYVRACSWNSLHSSYQIGPGCYKMLLLLAVKVYSAALDIIPG